MTLALAAIDTTAAAIKVEPSRPDRWNGREGTYFILEILTSCCRGGKAKAACLR